MGEKLIVNIYFDGMVPYLHIMAPVYDYELTREQYNLVRSQGINIQIISTVSNVVDNNRFAEIDAAVKEMWVPPQVGHVVAPVVLERDIVADTQFEEILPEEVDSQLSTKQTTEEQEVIVVDSAWPIKTEAELKEMTVAELKAEMKLRFDVEITGSPTRANIIRKYLEQQSK
jgi:hypothetical protein